MHAVLDIAVFTVVLVLICYHWETVLEALLSVGIVVWCGAKWGSTTIQNWLQ